MKQLFCIFIFIFSVAYSFGQNYFLDVRQRAFKYYRAKESKIKSQQIENNEYFALTSLAQPVKFLRINSGFRPQPIVEYFFSLPDSIVRRIHVEIDSGSYLPRTLTAMKGYKEKHSRLIEFDKEYDIIRNELIAFFGQPQSSKKLIEEDETWTRNDKWENDSLTVHCYLVFTGSQGRGNLIRANIDFKYGKGGPVHTIQGKINPQQDSIARLYISLLFNKDLERSWKLIDEAMKKDLTYEEYLKAVNKIVEIKNNIQDQVVLFMKGTRSGPSGQQMPYYSYRFRSDPLPPETLIDIVFKDEKSLKIAGLSSKRMKGIR